MAKIPSRNMNYSIGGVAIECNVKSLTRDFQNQMIDSESLCDAGPRNTVANYKWGTQLGGDDDFVAGSIDATLFALVANDVGAATILQPTGNAAGANDPNYTGTEKLESYQITAGIGQMVAYSAKMVGASAAVRAVA